LSKADHYVDLADVVKLRAKIVPTGSILFAKIGEAIRQNHRVVAGCEMLIDNNAMAAIPNASVDSRYLYHYLKTVDFYILAPATTVPALRKSDLEKLQVPLPPVPEQRRIAAILDQADALRAKRREALVGMDQLRYAIFDEMFGSPESNPFRWTTKTLGDLLVVIRNGVNAEQTEDRSGLPVTRIETIWNGEVDASRVKYVNVRKDVLLEHQMRWGDILFSHINSPDHIAKTAIYVGEPPVLVHGINLLRLRGRGDLVDPIWLLYFLKHPTTRTFFKTRCKKAINQASLNQQDIKSLRCIVPPLDRQQSFATRIHAVDSLKATHRAALDEVVALFVSIQHRAFRGEL